MKLESSGASFIPFVQYYDFISKTPEESVTNVRLHFSFDICMTMFW